MSVKKSVKDRHLRALLRNRCDKIVLSEEGVYVYSDLNKKEVYYCLTIEEKIAMQKTLEEEGYSEPVFYDNDRCQSLFIGYKGECKRAQKNFKGVLTILQQRNQFINRKEISEDELRQLLFLLSKHDHVSHCFSGRKKYELFCLRNKQTDPGHQYIIDLNNYIYEIYLELINLDDSYNTDVLRKMYLLFSKRRLNDEEIEIKNGIKEIFSYLGFKIYSK